MCLNERISESEEHGVDRYLAISSLWAVQSLMYSSCSLILCLMVMLPGPAVTAPELFGLPGRRAVPGLRRPALGEFLFEPNSSSEVEPYSVLSRRHLLLAADTQELVVIAWTGGHTSWQYFRLLNVLQQQQIIVYLL